MKFWRAVRANLRNTYAYRTAYAAPGRDQKKVLFFQKYFRTCQKRTAKNIINTNSVIEKTTSGRRLAKDIYKNVMLYKEIMYKVFFKTI